MIFLLFACRCRDFVFVVVFFPFRIVVVVCPLAMKGLYGVYVGDDYLANCEMMMEIVSGLGTFYCFTSGNS